MDDSTKKEETLTLQCPTCSARYLMPPWQEGQKYGCKKCGASLLFGKFALLQELGRGGFGVVYKAWQADLQRVVALKFLHADTEESVERFLREARIAANLSHPNITAIYEVGRHEGKPYITMQYVDGQTTNRAQLSPREAAMVVRDAAMAVDYAHGREIIHRDIKPHNIMMTAERSGTSASETTRRVFVMDFGLARSSRGDSSLTAEGQVMGTPAFMSPEQAEGKPLDFRSDVYSLGATLWALATRRSPFEAATPVQILMKVTRGEILRPSEVNPEVDPNLESIILKAMALDPGLRYTSAAQLAGDLSRWLQGDVPDSGATVHLSASSKVVRSTSSSPGSRKSGLAIAAAVAVAVAAAGAGAVLFLKRENPRPIVQPPPAEDYVAVRLESTPQGALVRASGVDRSWITPGEIRASEVKGTALTLTFSKPGYVPTSRSVSFSRSSPQIVLAALEAEPAPPPPPTTAVPKILLDAKAEPVGARMRLGGREYALPIQLSDREIAAGEVQVEIFLDGYASFTDILRLSPEKIVTLAPTLVRAAREPAFTLVSIPPGARVLLNEKDTGALTPCVIYRDQVKGALAQVELVLDGYLSPARPVEIKPASYEVKIELVPRTGSFSVSAAQPRAALRLVSVPPGAKNPRAIVQLWSENPEAVEAALAALDPADAPLAAPRLKELRASKYAAVAPAERTARLEMSTTADAAGNAEFPKVPVARRYHVLATSPGSRDYVSGELAAFAERQTVVRVEMLRLVTVAVDVRPPLGHFDVVADGKPAGRLDAKTRSLRTTSGVVVLKYVPPPGDPLLCAFSATKSVSDKLELSGNLYRLCGQAFEADRDVLLAVRAYTKALEDNAVPAAERAELDALPGRVRELYRAWIDGLPRKALGADAERRLQSTKAEDVVEVYASDAAPALKGRAAAALASAHAKLGRPYEAAEWLERAAAEGVDPGGEIQGVVAAAGRAYPGLAERARDAARRLDALRAARTRRPAFLGARGSTVEGRGLRVDEIAKGSPAEAELRYGDLITAVGGTPTPDAAALEAALAGVGAGNEAELAVERGGQRVSAKLTLVPPPARPPEWLKPPPRVGVLQLVSEQYGIYLRLDENAAVRPGETLEVVRGGEAIGELTAFKAVKADETYKHGGMECRKVKGEFRKGDEVRRPGR